jgi:hypothetical protein
MVAFRFSIKNVNFQVLENKQLKLFWPGCGEDDSLLAANRKFRYQVTFA